jgi:Tfp pilus assembly major pilin PilA
MVELLVVVGIIAILAAVAAPPISRYLRTYRLRGAAQEVIGEMTRARGKAIANNANRGVLFIPGVPAPTDPGTSTLNCYQFWVADDPASPGIIPTLPIPSQRGPAGGPPNGLVQCLPTGVYFVPAGTQVGNWGGRAVLFDRLGRACNPAGASCTDFADTPPNGTTFVAAATAPLPPGLMITLEERLPTEAEGTGRHWVRIAIEPGGKMITRDWTQGS